MAEQQTDMTGQEEVQGQQGAENVVYIGKKPSMNYVLAVVTQFNNGAKAVTIKARGNAIRTAVDVAEIALSRFINYAKKGSITTGSEEITNEDGTKSKVSTIQIPLSR